MNTADIEAVISICRIFKAAGNLSASGNRGPNFLLWRHYVAVYHPGPLLHIHEKNGPATDESHKLAPINHVSLSYRDPFFPLPRYSPFRSIFCPRLTNEKLPPAAPASTTNAQLPPFQIILDILASAVTQNFSAFSALALMDYAEAQKWISHTSQRPDSLPDTSSSSSISENAQQQNGGGNVLSQSLTPQISRMSRPPLSTRVTQTESTITRDPSFEVDWEDGDPDNPRNWPTWYKGFIIFSISFSTLVVYVLVSRLLWKHG
jgi:hypothetical protein